MTEQQQAKQLTKLYAAKASTLRSAESIFKEQGNAGKLDAHAIRESERRLQRLSGEAWGVVDAALALGFSVGWDADGNAYFKPTP